MPISFFDSVVLPAVFSAAPALPRTQAFLRNRARGLQPPATGAEDQQADCVARLAPLIAMYAGDERLMRLVEAATRTTQNTDAAAAWGCAGAAVLERLLLGQAAEQAVRETVQELQQQQNGGGECCRWRC